METNVEKTKVMRISRQPSPVTIMIDQKQLENGECFKYLGSLLTNDGRCTRKIKSRIAWQKLHSVRSRLIYQQIGLKFEKETNKMPHLEYSFLWC